MPQMAPMNWTLLYIFFILLFMFISLMNYYSFSYKNKTSLLVKTTQKTNWKS
uniref:ATP synthase complex subunit 8 n=1 Tax=Trigonopterus sp. 5 AH-2016 TaxID=1903839 RepID=A0A343C466_9CUCU|nr:ATP synthase F0 subunit 8 [Trigonopterus sp. 5 AH-2016]